MPKSTKEETLKKKIQARALYELGKHTKQEIYAKINIDHKTLTKWINEDPEDIWQVRDRAENRIYEAEKIVHKNKILKQFKKQEDQFKDDIITQQAKDEATQEAMILLDLERERNRLTKAMLEKAYIVNKYIIDLIKKGKTEKLIEEDIVWEGIKTKEKKYTKQTEEHTLPEVVKANEMIIKSLYGLGVLRTTPAIAIQQNNNNNTPKVVFVDNKEKDEIENHILETINDK